MESFSKWLPKLRFLFQCVQSQKEWVGPLFVLLYWAFHDRIPSSKKVIRKCTDIIKPIKKKNACMVLAYIIVPKSATFHAEILSVLKKKTEWRGSQIDFKWFQEQKVLGGWLDYFFLKLTVNQARSKNKKDLTECKTHTVFTRWMLKWSTIKLSASNEIKKRNIDLCLLFRMREIESWLG